MTWFDTLAERLEEQSQRPRTLAAGDGRLLIADHGARILGVELPAAGQNLVFATDATGPDGHITGGDRLWIAPEVGWYWPSLEEARRDPKGTAVTPEAIDPGDYQVQDEREQGVELASADALLNDVRDGKEVRCRWHRGFRMLTEASEQPTAAGLQHVGFVITNSLTVSGGDPGAVAGCWDILQVPVGGTLLCPVTMAIDPRSYYDPFGDRHVQADARCVRFLIDGTHRIKMGLRPEHTTGRMGYYRPVSDSVSTLLVRIFAPLPGEPYCDIPRDHPDDQRLGGDALQAYNDDGDVFPGTSFGEMEYHDPCGIVGEPQQGQTIRTGSCVTHCYAGPDAAIREIGEHLLGVPVAPIT